MGARNLEARLTARLFGLAGGVIVLVGVSSVLVTRKMLDANDTDSALAHARSALDTLETELAEGDALTEAGDEVVLLGERQGARVRLERDGRVFGDPSVRVVPAGSCETYAGDGDEIWRACGAADARGAVAAAIPVGAHHRAVASLARGMVAVVAVALALVWLAIRRAIRQPIGELAAVVAWTARIPDADAPAAPPPVITDEVARLAGAFDALVRRLLDVLARERASSAHIAHELRTPLTAIRAELEAVRAADEPSREALARVRADVVRFADVIDAILLLSEAPRAISGTARRAGSVVNVADIARELAPPGAVVEAPDEALVEADDHLVRLALRNLVDNAKKYAGGARAVRVSRADESLAVTVVDAGPGVERSARERMFDRYWRGSADGDGRGLGLALVRAVAERHGGRARADDGEGGCGLSVTLTLGHVLEWRETL